MIVEFFGLPGAGKTTLENATLRVLAQRGITPLLRDDAVSSYIASWSHVPRDRFTPARRAASALYKARLFGQSLISTPRLLRPAEVAVPHLVRSATRMAENTYLYPWIRSRSHEFGIAVLCEGIVQHAIAHSAWRTLLRPARPAIATNRLLDAILGEDNLLVQVKLPVRQATARLATRGAPQLWPASVSHAAVQDAFAAATARLIPELPCKIIEVEAATAGEDWQEQAHQLAEQLLAAG